MRLATVNVQISDHTGCRAHLLLAKKGTSCLRLAIPNVPPHLPSKAGGHWPDPLWATGQTSRWRLGVPDVPMPPHLSECRKHLIFAHGWRS